MQIKSSTLNGAIGFIEHDSPLGTLLLAATAQGLTGVYFEEHRHFKGSAGWLREAENPILCRTADQLDAYFAGQRISFDVPLDLHGTPFQRAVWQQLCAIPFGQTTSYGSHAAAIGKPAAVRAVGAAIGRNPVSIIVPCHRVVSATQALTGYAGGLARKQRLLDAERR